MLANIKDMSDEITTLLDFNRNFLSRIQLDELYHMKGKLDYILAIKKCMWDIDNIHLSRDSEASTVVSTKAHTPKVVPNSFACSSGYYEAPAAAAETVVTRENIAGENPLTAAVERERKEMADSDMKAISEAQSLPHSDSTPSMNELLFSKALMKSMKQSGEKDCPSPNTLAYATIATGLRVEVNSDAAGCVVQAAGAQTPKTIYRTIALSTSSPKG